MKARTTQRFRPLLAALPVSIQLQVRQAYRMFLQDPAHPGLRFQQVLAEPPTYSARVEIGYRALGVLDGDTVVWFWIGDQPGYERLLEQL